MQDNNAQISRPQEGGQNKRHPTHGLSHGIFSDSFQQIALKLKGTQPAPRIPLKNPQLSCGGSFVSRLHWRRWHFVMGLTELMQGGSRCHSVNENLLGKLKRANRCLLHDEGLPRSQRQMRMWTWPERSPKTNAIVEVLEERRSQPMSGAKHLPREPIQTYRVTKLGDPTKQTFFNAFFSGTLRVMDVRAKNRGRPPRNCVFPRTRCWGETSWPLVMRRNTVRVTNVRKKFGPKSLCLCCFSSLTN